MSQIDDWKIEQEDLVKRLEIYPTGKIIALPRGSIVCTLDVQYKENEAFVGMDVLDWETGVNQQFVRQESVDQPYVPGFFAFREGPVLLRALRKLQKHLGQWPELLIIEGHGTAHPRKMGLASWVGVKSSLPSIGVAKDPLIRQTVELGEEQGAHEALEMNGELLGYVLRSRTDVKPIYVSAGYRISQEQALAVIKSFLGEYRIIEPVRRADQTARKAARGEAQMQTVYL
ncbi:MAG: endonuclease V [Bacteroidota bacterium]